MSKSFYTQVLLKVVKYVHCNVIEKEISKVWQGLLDGNANIVDCLNSTW